MNAPKAVNRWLDLSQEITPETWPILLMDGLELIAWSPRDLATAIECDPALVTPGAPTPHTYVQLAAVIKIRRRLRALWNDKPS